MIVKLQNHWRNDLRRWPHSSTFTYRHILFHKTLLLDIFFTLAASILRQSLIQTSKKFSSSYFFIFSFRSSEEVKCSPKQTSLIPLSFFILPWNYYKNTFRYLSYGKTQSCQTDWLGLPTILLYKNFPSSHNFIFMARVELVIGVVGFISGFFLKKQSLSDFLFFPEKNYWERDMKNVADVFCKVSFTNNGCR